MSLSTRTEAIDADYARFDMPIGEAMFTKWAIRSKRFVGAKKLVGTQPVHA